jgi:molybdenum cofactor synthesis domain-containing protein
MVGMSSAAVLTVSDRVAAGEAIDSSGPAVAEVLRAAGFDVVELATVSDDPDVIAAELRRLCTSAQLVLTTGGTGLGPRDRTPEATLSVADYSVPGVAEHMRRAGANSTEMAILSRGLAVVRRRSLIVNLPGSERGAVESLDSVIKVLPHALDLLRGGTGH